MKSMANAMRLLALTGLLATGIGCSNGNVSGTPDHPGEAALVADHQSVTHFGAVPSATFSQLRSDCRIYYGHTSHGSQIVTGLQMLADENVTYALPTITEPGGDLGGGGNLAWATTTRDYLDAHPGEYQLVMWSWCGGVSDNTVGGINAYLEAMAALEADYPDVVFVYMTGHLDGSGEGGNLKARNDQIRSYCVAHGKVLFDFADIESHDPDGLDHPDESDACTWCSDWCATHDCPPCGGCAHSHCFNCYRKGQAFWVLLSRLAAAQRL